MAKFMFACLLVGSFVSAGCASNHDLTKGSNMLGGGYKQDELGPGFFHIYARSNHAPFTNAEAARTTWRTGAERACSSSDFDELNVQETEKDTGLQNSGGVRYFVSERTGYAKCDSSKLNTDEIKKIIQQDFAVR